MSSKKEVRKIGDEEIFEELCGDDFFLNEGDKLIQKFE